MNAFLAQASKFPALFAVLLFFTFTGTALSESRMAGSIPVMAPKNKSNNSAIIRIESYGLIRHFAQGGLGIDMWNKTDHAFVLEQMEALPVSVPYRTLQNLNRRMLLTAADAGLMVRRTRRIRKQDTRQSDLLTVRIEKLMAMGAFSDAAALYTLNPDEPYSARLARAGILALLQSKQSGLACLETRASEKKLEKEFSSVIFLQQLSKICSYIMGDKAKNKPAFETEGLLHRLVSDPDYVFQPDSKEEFEALSVLERILLFEEGKIDYSHLNQADTQGFSPVILNLILEDHNLPDAFRIGFLVDAVERGYRDKNELTAFYNSIKFDKEAHSIPLEDIKKQMPRWKEIALLYHRVSLAKTDKARAEVMEHALRASTEQTLTTVLFPFMSYLKNSGKKYFSTELIRESLLTFTFADIPYPSAWTARILDEKPKLNNQEFAAFFMHLETVYNKKNEEEYPLQQYDLTYLFQNREKNIVSFVLNYIIKLDKGSKLHNYVVSEIYEKPIDLTSHVNYVMPSVDLINRLAEARQKNRLGEVVLLSSSVLQRSVTEEVKPGPLLEVLDSFITVGLIREARSLARDAVLGFE